jgi:HAD superfamily hydrolase (TIGR01458 family)
MPRALLIDISGTLLDRESPFPGVAQWFARLKQSQIPFRLLTNTTIQTRTSLCRQLQNSGLDIAIEHIINPESVAYYYCQNQFQNSSIRLLLKHVEMPWHEFTFDDDNPGLIILGDLGPELNRSLLDSIFRQMLAGSKLIALHKSRYWRNQGRLELDLGGFVALLEYATGKVAQIVGKPSVDFFTSACAAMKVPAREVLMIGDDLHGDCLAARQAGLQVLQVRTGKCQPDDDSQALEAGIKQIATIADVAFAEQEIVWH